MITVPVFLQPKQWPLTGWLAGALLAFLLLGPAPAAHAQTWMVSTTAQIKLGILDKYGQLGPYTATFVVHSEKTGKDYLLVKELTKGQTGVGRTVFPPTRRTRSISKPRAGRPPMPPPAATPGSAG